MPLEIFIYTVSESLNNRKFRTGYPRTVLLYYIPESSLATTLIDDMEQKKRSKLQQRRLWLFILSILITCVTRTSIETKNLRNFRFTTSDNVASINYSSNNIVKSQSQGQHSNGNSNNNDIQ